MSGDSNYYISATSIDPNNHVSVSELDSLGRTVYTQQDSNFFGGIPAPTPNEQTTIVFEYRLDDASIECGDCAKRVKSTLTAQVHIQPTGQLFPITVTFGIPPELEKQIPKQ